MVILYCVSRFINQNPKLKAKMFKNISILFQTYRDFFTNIPSTNPITVIIAVICMVILYCVSRFINQNPKLKAKMFMPVPTELIVVSILLYLR